MKVILARCWAPFARFFTKEVLYELERCALFFTAGFLYHGKWEHGVAAVLVFIAWRG